MTTSSHSIPILSTEGVCISHQGELVLKDISVELFEGEIVCLLGKSGGGKTTLFNIISGVLTPDKGKVFLKGQDITSETGHVSYMLQKDLLLPYLKVIDNVSLPLRIQGRNKADSRTEAAKHFATFDLEGTEYLYPSQLSGGMRQRVALMRTYLFSKEVSLLDEPFSALDTITKSAIHDWYLAIMEEIKLSTFFITHDIEEAIKLSDRIYVLGANPGHITDEFIIEEKRPRSHEFMLSTTFLNYKRQIIDAIEA